MRLSYFLKVRPRKVSSENSKKGRGRDSLDCCFRLLLLLSLCVCVRVCVLPPEEKQMCSYNFGTQYVRTIPDITFQAFLSSLSQLSNSYVSLITHISFFFLLLLKVGGKEGTHRKVAPSISNGSAQRDKLARI